MLIPGISIFGEASASGDISALPPDARHPSYLRDNAQELAFMVRYKPIKNLRIVVQYVMAEAGELYGYTGTNRDGWGLPFIDAAKWKSDRIRLKASYEIINDIRVFGSYQYSNVSGDYSSLYTMPYYQGKQSTVSFGVVVGI